MAERDRIEEGREGTEPVTGLERFVVEEIAGITHGPLWNDSPDDGRSDLSGTKRRDERRAPRRAGFDPRARAPQSVDRLLVRDELLEDRIVGITDRPQSLKLARYAGSASQAFENGQASRPIFGQPQAI